MRTVANDDEPARPSVPEDLQRAFSRGFDVVLADTDALRDEVFALRYQVYCVENPFEDPSQLPDQLERDVFDDRAHHALLRHKPTGLCAGALRLVVTDPTSPTAHLPIEVFCDEAFDRADRQRMAQLPRAHTGEVSRFAISKQFRRRYAEHLTTTGITEQNLFGDTQAVGHREMMRRATSHLTIGLFCGLFRLAVTHEITYLYAVMEPPLLRLLARFGIDFEPIGRLVDYHGRRQPALGDLRHFERRMFDLHPDIWSLAMNIGKDKIAQ